MHVAAALDSIGGLLGVQEFPATAAGYASLLGWLRGFGTLAVAGVEGTGSYGAGLARQYRDAREGLQHPTDQRFSETLCTPGIRRCGGLSPRLAGMPRKGIQISFSGTSDARV
jgi:hypothetical protein